MAALSQSSSLIERELLRKVKYEAIRKWFHEKIKARNFMDSSHILLRYRFNLRQRSTDDPVFVTNASAAADAQFSKDFSHFRLGNDPSYILIELKRRIAAAAREVATTKVQPDGSVIVADGYLTYKGMKYKDLRGLGAVDANAAFALHLRYDYLKLENHGLARVYGGEKNSAAEAFATAFNHRFETWCSAFPDLEAQFGSKGSFFDQKQFDPPIVYVNPPFDETMITLTLAKVYELLEQGANNVFVLTFPFWQDLRSIVEAENSKWTHEIREFQKGELPFIDYTTGKTIYPSDIIQLILAIDKEKALAVASSIAGS